MSFFVNIDGAILIKCYDEDFNVIGYVDDFRSFKWGYSWSGCGHWEIILSDSSAHSVNIFKAASYIECHNVPSRVFRDNIPVVDGVITKITTSLRVSGGTVKVEGYELKGLAKRRIIATNETYTDNAAAQMYKLLNKQIVNAADTNRNIFGTIQNLSTSTETIETTPQQYTNLADNLENISSESGVGYQAAIGDISQGGTVIGKGISWGIIDGFDRTINQTDREQLRLTFDNETLDEATYEVEMESSKNTAYIGGKGEGASRKIKVAYEGDETKTGLERVEIFVDARNEAEGALIGKGKEAITEYGENQTIKLKPSYSLLKKFGTDYFVGDKATFVNLNQNLTLTEAAITFEANTVKCDMTFGYDKKTVKNAMNILMRSYKNMLNV